MELLKAKYTTLAKQKNTESEELLTAESQKLELARALVEMRLQHSEFMESSEKSRFELTTTILTLKNELFTIDGNMQILQVFKN